MNSLPPFSPFSLTDKPAVPLPEPASKTEITVESVAPASPAPAQLADRLRTLDDPAPASGPTRGHRFPWMLATACVLVLVAALVTWSTRSVFGDPYKNLELDYRLVERGRVVFTIVERGELEAARSSDVNCMVRNRAGAWFATTIKWLVGDGTFVKKGDVVLRLEDSGLKDQLQAQTIAVTEKKALLIEAQREQEIVASQNQINLKTAFNNYEIAKINLSKYLEGDLLQKRKDVRGRMTLAQADIGQLEDRVGWSSRMVKRGFISAIQGKADELRLQSALITFDRIVEEERMLENFDRRVTELDLTNKRDQTEVALKVARTEAEGKAAKAEANLQARTTVLDQEETKLRLLMEDIRSCQLTAPNDGMVVYFIPEQSRTGTGSQKGIIAVGEPVYEGQKLMQIPDLRQMQVRVKVHESVQPRLREDRTSPSGQGLAVMAALTLATLPEINALGTVLAAPEIRRVAAEAGLIREEIVSKPGHEAQIKISSLDRVLKGRIRWISSVASQNDSISSDVRIYPTLINVEDRDEALKSGISAEVTIFVDQRDKVVRLPVHSVLEVGGEKFCYVKNGGDIERRVLETGLNNNWFIEIRHGLEEGELVVQNPRQLAEQRGDLNARGKAEESVSP
jgi:HlyD family secretion protein